MLISIIILFVMQLLLPAYFIYSLWVGRLDSRFAWLVKTLYSGAFILYVFLTGRWDWLSYYLRYLIIVLFVAAALIAYRRVSRLPFFVQNGRRWWQRFAWPVIELLIFAGILAYALRGYFYSDPPVRLAFPLQDGRYYVGQGGNSPVLNYHNVSEAQKYALDILELNAVGARASGIYPNELERYAIFGETVHSPCDGAIVEAVDGLPDHIPPATDQEQVAGNHVVIACQDVQVVLAHLKNGSLLVQVGEAVTTGQPLGQVGNSGNTSEPHLHIHAVQGDAPSVLEGEGMPILFEGNFPVRNTVYVE
jgi:hypothetical protein